MITVHHLNNSKSQRILWLLEELKMDYEIVNYTRQPTMAAPPEMREIHPLGKAPIVDIDGHIMAESGAVVEYIVHKFGNGRLTPGPNSEHYGHYLEMLHYPEGSANTPFFLNLIVSFMGLAGSPLEGFAKESSALHLGYMESLLEGNDYLVGNEFSAADIQMTFILQGSKRGGGLEEYPNLSAFVDRMEARPAFIRSVEKGGVFDLNFGG
ncbi:MAG: glutathione S-transferase family protein [Proteobacteria bacterium]|nr:glutathione S-transferase family protein [Pseudomonadota bacterium]